MKSAFQAICPALSRPALVQHAEPMKNHLRKQSSALAKNRDGVVLAIAVIVQVIESETESDFQPSGINKFPCVLVAK